MERRLKTFLNKTAVVQSQLFTWIYRTVKAMLVNLRTPYELSVTTQCRICELKLPNAIG